MFATVVFADLKGSSKLFELRGNDQATRVVTKLTRWMGSVLQQHGGHVVKLLGDGVLVVFPASAMAVNGVVALQRQHTQRIAHWPAELQITIRVGLAAGDVIEVEGDCYGDAVNVAARLTDRCGPEQVWATENVVAQLVPPPGVRWRKLGPIQLKGMQGARPIVQVEWHEDVMSELLTQPAAFWPGSGGLTSSAPPAEVALRLTWLGAVTQFGRHRMPVIIGRVPGVDFLVDDPRVSRQHARIDYADGAFTFTDTSSYGSWLRFDGSDTEVSLRRGESVLHGSGEMALGAPFADFSVPTVRFELVN
jgi:adenylate cyclase